MSCILSTAPHFTDSGCEVQALYRLSTAGTSSLVEIPKVLALHVHAESRVACIERLTIHKTTILHCRVACSLNLARGTQSVAVTSHDALICQSRPIEDVRALSRHRCALSPGSERSSLSQISLMLLVLLAID